MYYVWFTPSRHVASLKTLYQNAYFPCMYILRVSGGTALQLPSAGAPLWCGQLLAASTCATAFHRAPVCVRGGQTATFGRVVSSSRYETIASTRHALARTYLLGTTPSVLLGPARTFIAWSHLNSLNLVALVP